MAFVQGVLTICGVVFGVLCRFFIAAMTAAGELLLLGIGIRLLQLKEVRVADMLPALAVALCSPSSSTLFDKPSRLNLLRFLFITR